MPPVPRIRVTVLDMQPIAPAVGGGRLRLLGLYHALGAEFDATYVGSFDWPGEVPRELRLSQTLLEIDVPLSPAHFREDARWRQFAGGETVIDTTFPILGRLSEDFLSRARASMRDADVIVFSHPWLHPLLAGDIDRARQAVVYDAHNVEALLRREILGGSPFGCEIANGVAVAEAFLCRDADLVVCCSEEDSTFFTSAYGIASDRVEVVPNGVFVRQIVPDERRAQVRGIDKDRSVQPVVLFIGSEYPPNLEAVRFIVRTLAPALPEVILRICGGAAAAAGIGSDLPANVRLVGRVSDADKLRHLQDADVAVNPMFSGSGTNIKMFDFMAAGLPVVSTPIGARGICTGSRYGIVVCHADDMVKHIERLWKDSDLRGRLGAANREWAEREFAWEKLSPSLGGLLERVLSRRGRASRRGRDDGVPLERATERTPHVPSPLVDFRSLAILSTFGIRCGIGEYTSYLAEALLETGTRVTIVANDLEGHEKVRSNLSQREGLHVERLWRYDNLFWTEGHVDPSDVVQLLRTRGAQHLNVQYHRAFFAEDVLVELIRAVLAAGMSVSVSLHNSNDATPHLLGVLAPLPVTVLVHRRSEQDRLRGLGIAGALYMPLGIGSSAKAGGTSRTDVQVEAEPMIGTFGFLRPHKGLLELIEALSILRPQFPGVRLIANTALYPSSDSTAYLERARERIKRLGMGDAITLDSSFLSIDEVIERLSRVDLVVLPYSVSDEGSSAAAATALAAARPLVTSSAPIFDDLRGIAYTAEDNSPPVLAVAIGTVIANGALRRHLARCSRREAEYRSWNHVARRFLECIGAVQTKSAGAAASAAVPLTNGTA